MVSATKKSALDTESKKRPEGVYPTNKEILTEALIAYIRGPAIGTLVVLLAWPFYKQAADWWLSTDLLGGLSERWFWILCTLGVHQPLYYGVNSFFLLCTHKGWFKKYQLPRTKRMLHTPELLRETIKESIINNFVSQPISLYVLYPLIKGAGMCAINAELPSVLGIWRDLACAAFWNEFLFYWMHRTFHEVPFLYRHIHKQHHRYVGTIGFAAEFAHPVEQIFANQLPTVFYCFMFGVHPLVYSVWIAWRMLETYEAHSGYCFSQSRLGQLGLLNGGHAAFHDYHHTINTGNYGGPLFDGLFKSMDQWVKNGGENGVFETDYVKEAAKSE